MASGTIWHRRNMPTVHQFSYGVNQIWLDPDRPEDLFDLHRLWSHRSPRPVRFKRRDYFDGEGGAIGPTIRSELATVLGYSPNGAIRMLTQPRTWGWLFNPITIYLAWHDNGEAEEQGAPIAAVLEVTNTPWKERIRYPVALSPSAKGQTARFAKKLHVSPFLNEDFDYELSVKRTCRISSRKENQNEPPHSDPPAQDIEIGLDVHPTSGSDAEQAEPVVETRLQLQLTPATRSAMTPLLYRNPLPTHRVSMGIHWQAVQLLHKRVPFVAHPGKRP